MAKLILHVHADNLFETAFGLEAKGKGPLTYADGLVLAIDGGRYDGGPLLLVELT